MPGHYRKAYTLGKTQVKEDIARGVYPYLPALDAMINDVATMQEIPVGTQEISCDLIVGTRTRGRQNVFSRGFMPLAEPDSEFAGKWDALFDSQLAEGIRDPIRVYEYLQHFYVLEGNKRASVMKFLKMPSMEADIIRIMPHPTDDHEYLFYREFLEFWQVCPLYGLDFTHRGSYELLAEELGLDLKHVWSEDVLRSLRAFLSTFGVCFRKRATQDNLSFTVADALLVYLKLFGKDSLSEYSPARIQANLDAIWDELVVSLGKDAVTYVEEPRKETSVTKRVVSGLIRNHRTTGGSRRPLRIAFLYEGDPTSSGWTLAHDEGRRYLEQQLGDAIETVPFYGCDNKGRFDAAIEAAVHDKDDLVVTTSPRQMGLTLSAAVSHPKMEFLNCSLNLASARVRTLYGKLHEPKFILGALAAIAAENHRIGYLASYPVYGALAEVNAFALGAQMIDPDATVMLRWSSRRDGDWYHELLDAGAHVISGRDYYDPHGQPDSFGVWKETTHGPQQLAYPLWGWGRCLELVSRYLIDDLWEKGGSVRHRPLNYWWGMGTGAVDIRLCPELPQGPARLAELLKTAIIDGQLRPFEGLINTQEGVVGRVGSSLTNAEIATMTWLAGNIEGTLPSYDELDDAGKAIVRVSGIIDAPPEVTPRRPPVGTPKSPNAAAPAETEKTAQIVPHNIERRTTGA